MFCVSCIFSIVLVRIPDFWSSDSCECHFYLFTITQTALFQSKYTINESIFHFRASAIARRRKAWFHLGMSRVLFCSQTQLDNIAHEQTIICGQLFVGHLVGSRPMKRRANFTSSGNVIYLI